MSTKIKLGDEEYELEEVKDEIKSNLATLEFVSNRIKELQNMQAILQRAKISYMNDLKKEMIAKKSGFILDTD
jgi:hypothetical protein